MRIEVNWSDAPALHAQGLRLWAVGNGRGGWPIVRGDRAGLHIVCLDHRYSIMALEDLGFRCEREAPDEPKVGTWLFCPVCGLSARKFKCDDFGVMCPCPLQPPLPTSESPGADECPICGLSHDDAPSGCDDKNCPKAPPSSMVTGPRVWEAFTDGEGDIRRRGLQEEAKVWVTDQDPAPYFEFSRRVMATAKWPSDSYEIIEQIEQMARDAGLEVG